MNFLESVKIALSAIRVNKMRSLLTMLGIIIGISSVIAVVALGDGLKSTIGEEFEKFGVSRIYLGYNWRKDIMRRDFFTYQDLDALRRAFEDEISAMSPTFEEGGKVIDRQNDRKEIDVTLNGVNEEFDGIQHLDIVEGRFLVEGDLNSNRLVAVIDKELGDKFYSHDDYLGERMTVKSGDQTVSVVIVGVFEKKNSKINAAFGYTPPLQMYVPISTMSNLYGIGNWVYGVEINLEEGTPQKETIDRMTAFMERRHKNEGDEKYMGYSAEQELETVNKITGSMTMVVSAIAAISLLVGGIGVMNIMLVSVTERTREIGIRKSLGAKHKDILIQFLVEAVIISVIGGILGTAIGTGLAYIAAYFIKVPPSVRVITVIIAWLFSAGVGIFFGIFPANKAAKLDPIEALRYE